MAADVTRDEFLHLEARVGVVEQEVEGEKMVTRHILEQSRRNGEDLADFKKRTDQRFDSLERRFDNLERRFDSLERQFDGLDRTVSTLRKDLPTLVGDVMRDVLQERDKKR
jgi:predicted  nucleic acid-binding Zn-ribbon protein